MLGSSLAHALRSSLGQVMDGGGRVWYRFGSQGGRMSELFDFAVPKRPGDMTSFNFM